jgi:large subunit ribosomal protein L4
MPKANVFDMAGKQVGEIELSEAIFGIEPNERRCTTFRQESSGQLPSGHAERTLTKGEVSYSTRKPWKQKGTGRARAGSTGSPQWDPRRRRLRRSPAITATRSTRRSRKLAMKSALSAKAASEDIIVIDGMKMDEIKTKTFKGFLDKLGVPARLWSSPRTWTKRREVRPQHPRRHHHAPLIKPLR